MLGNLLSVSDVGFLFFPLFYLESGPRYLILNVCAVQGEMVP